MRLYARWLFGVAAAANVAVGAAFVFAQPLLVRLLALDPVAGTNAVFAATAGVLIAAFGYGYARIALDPVRYRPLIHIGAIGKLAAVATAALFAALDPRGLRFLMLVSGDAVLAGLFLDYLRRTRA